ncbi:hypothetical protein C9J85_02700 [Haloferax sp. wsp5]|nr:hypothetical protein C9J85_02700 [Haloferax sp. wsp5]
MSRENARGIRSTERASEASEFRRFESRRADFYLSLRSVTSRPWRPSRNLRCAQSRHARSARSDATSERARSSNPASRSAERSEATVWFRFESRETRQRFTTFANLRFAQSRRAHFWSTACLQANRAVATRRGS